MAQIVEMTGHRGLAVCANGALVYDLHREEVVERFLLEADDATSVAQALRDELPEIAFAVERPDLGFAHEQAYVPSWEDPDHSPLPVDELVRGGVVKLLARHPGLGSDDLLAAARAAVGDAVTLTHSSSDGLLEISAAGISKATGLAALAREHGVEATDVVAFGDMPNDLPMLAWAGRGVAVANAHPEVLELADEVTASNDDDGVAQVLERWF
jgi:hydroxymethylpyrimidine pyrophosphatase-like HAD family hydrolase